MKIGADSYFSAHLSVLGVDDVKLRQLELPLVAHGHGGVVPAVAHLGHGVGNYKTDYKADTRHVIRPSSNCTQQPLKMVGISHQEVMNDPAHTINDQILDR